MHTGDERHTQARALGNAQTPNSLLGFEPEIPSQAYFPVVLVLEGNENFKMQGSAGKADHCNLICHSWLISMGGLPSYKEKLKKRSGKGEGKSWEERREGKLQKGCKNKRKRISKDLRVSLSSRMLLSGSSVSVVTTSLSVQTFV